MLTGNIGKHGAGVTPWAGNYKGRVVPGVGLERTRRGQLHARRSVQSGARRERPHHEGKPAAHDRRGRPVVLGLRRKTLTVDLPNGGRANFTGETHMPTPTKVVWYNNANFLNQAKWIYNIIVNVLPKVDMIVDQQIEWTGSAEYSDVVLPVNSWVEFEDYECGGSCSNPFLQVWKGGIKPVHDTIDDAAVFAGVARALAGQDRRQAVSPTTSSSSPKRKPRSYIQRVFDNSTTTRGKDGPYDVDKMIAGEYGGEPGAALMLFRTYPRVPFWEQIHDSIPFYTDSGRLAQLLRPARGDRVRREPHRASRRSRGHALSAERDRFDQPLHSAGRLRHSRTTRSTPICGRSAT